MSVVENASGGARAGRSTRWWAGGLVAVLLAGIVACAPTVPEADAFGLTAEMGPGGVVLRWAPVAAATGYDLQYNGPGTDGWVALASVVGPTAEVPGLGGGDVYLFRVRTSAGGEQLQGQWSRPLSYTAIDPVLPVVRLETAARAPIVGTETYVAGQFALEPNGAPFPALQGAMQIKGRGNVTALQAKRPYKIKLDSKASVLGMSSAKDWVLLANYFDRSQLRTFTAMSAGESTSLAFTPDLHFVEVVLNGEYLGVYEVAEQVEVKSNRVDIEEMESDDLAGEALTGGYLLEIDERLEVNGEPGFRTRSGLPVVIKEPEPPAPEQAEYIRSQVQAFETALLSADFADPVTGYAAYLDVDSFIDSYLVQELVRNPDAFLGSTYFHKDRGGKIVFGPLWDFDTALSTVRTATPAPPEGWWVRRPAVVWVDRLFQDPAFVQRVVERWDALEPAFAELPAMLLDTGAALEPATANDALRWRYVTQPIDQPQYLADWLSTRIAWIDAQFHPAG